MNKDYENIIKRIILKMTDECDIITIKHIHNNSFGLVIEYYSLAGGRNFTITLTSILDILDRGLVKLMEADYEQPNKRV